MPYGRALAEQRRIAREKIDGGEAEDWLLLLEHRPVVTLGRGARGGRNLPAPELLAARGIEVVEIERGGDVTYHGPGQLVGYPILDLSRWRKDLHWYVRTLEEALIRALGALGLNAFRAEGYTGVWVGQAKADLPAAEVEARIRAGEARKIASIGVHVSRWVTWHGFALNVTDEPLDSFRLIVPCGIPDVRMTSLAGEGAPTHRPRVDEAVRQGFGAAFQVDVEATERGRSLRSAAS